MKKPVPCGEPGCWVPVKRGRLCEAHRTAHRTATRKRNRAKDLCGCGLPPQAGLTRLGRPWTKCRRCSARQEIRELRRMIRLAGVAKAAAPAKALKATVPKHLRYLGEPAATLQWRFEVERDRKADEERLRELRHREEWRLSAGSAEFECPVVVCTRCHAALSSPGRRRCDMCRQRHTAYMRTWRSAPWRREAENARESYRRAAHMEEYRARDREKTRAARVIRDRDREIERLEAKLTQAVEVMRLARTIEDQEEVRR